MSVRLKRLSIILAVLICVLLVAAAIPIVVVEAGCGQRRHPWDPGRPLTDIQDAGYRRAEGNSFLTYPEWYIVHAYTDLAGVTRRSSEVRLRIWTARSPGFWTEPVPCDGDGAKNRAGDGRSTHHQLCDQASSFSLEMAVQGSL